MDHGDLEQRTVGQHCLRRAADERDVVDHLGGDPSADVADDQRVAEAQAEEVRRVDAWIETCDHEQAQVGEDDGALVAAGGGESAVALECRVHAGGGLVVAHGVLSPMARGSNQMRAAAVAGVLGARTSGASSALVVGWAGRRQRHHRACGGDTRGEEVGGVETVEEFRAGGVVNSRGERRVAGVGQLARGGERRADGSLRGPHD